MVWDDLDLTHHSNMASVPLSQTVIDAESSWLRNVSLSSQPCSDTNPHANVRQMYNVVDNRCLAVFTDYTTDNIVVNFGGLPSLRGRQQAEEEFKKLFDGCASLAHQ